MSIKIDISKLNENDIEEMEKHLIIEETNKSLQKKRMKYPWIQIPKYNLVHKNQETTIPHEKTEQKKIVNINEVARIYSLIIDID